DAVPRVVAASVLMAAGMVAAILLGAVTRRSFESAGIRGAPLRGQVVGALVLGFAALVALEQLGFATQFVMGIGITVVAAAELAPDDFSAWVGTVVQDRVTAERLSYAVQSRRGAAEPLRMALLETLEGVGERQRRSRAAPEGGEFPMLTFESVAVPTGLQAHDAESLGDAMAAADAGAWFHHVVEQPWLDAEGPRLGDWLRARGASRLGKWFDDLAASGLPLEVM